MSEPLTEKHYTPRQVAEMFEVTPATVRLWINGNKIKAIRLPGGQLRIPDSEVRALANERYAE